MVKNLQVRMSAMSEEQKFVIPLDNPRGGYDKIYSHKAYREWT